MLPPHEASLLRGWIQGLTWTTLADLYLAGASAEHIRATVDALRQRLLRKAERLGQSELAQTLRRDRRSQTAWQQAALRALDALQRRPDPLPQPDSPVALWLPPRIARCLQAQGLTTLAEVARFMAEHGPDFWHALPRLGEASARPLRRFFQDHAATLGPLDWPQSGPEAPETAAAGPARRGGLAPLEGVLLPDALDGRHGDNRAVGRCRIDAANDREAIAAWLARWPADSPTHRAYRKEAERFLLWCLLERGKAFASANSEDGLAYRRFLAEPTPKPRWVGPWQPRSHPDWRPFQGGLSERSRQQAEGILSALCAWLVGRRYLDSNPFEGLPKPRRRARRPRPRAFSEAQWRWLLAYVERRQRESQGRAARRYARLRLLLRFAYGTGLRRHELAQARFGDLDFRSEAQQWWLHVRGKGHQDREVPLPAWLWAELTASWRERGLPSQPQAVPPDTPLLAALRRTPSGTAPDGARHYQEAGLTPSGVSQALKAFFREAGAALAQENEPDGQRLQAASAHWLRHTHGSHAVRRGVPIELVRDNLGHRSLATTSIYIHTERDQRYRAMAQLSEAPAPSGAAGERPGDGAAGSPPGSRPEAPAGEPGAL